MRETKPIKPIQQSYFPTFSLLFFFLIPFASFAQGWAQNIKRLASDGGTTDNYGNSVTMAGDFMAIGAWTDDDGGTDAGAVYLYSRHQGGAENWGFLKKLTASDAASNDNFGKTIFIDGDYLIVGAVGDASSAGSAYLFKRNQGGSDNWGQLKKLTASDAATNDFFGTSVSLSDEYAIVGANGNDDGGSASGSAYLYKKDNGGIDNWGQLKKLTATSAASNDNFGNSVSINGDYLVVGAQGHVNNLGCAFLFEKDNGGTDNWGQLIQLYAGDAMPNENFGSSVSISGEYVAIGAKNDNFKVGAAYIYYQNEGGSNSWGQQIKLIASGSAANDLVGGSVFLRDNSLVVGAEGAGSGSGAAYVFNKDFGGDNTWGELHKLTASDGVTGDAFGFSVAFDGTDLIIGAHLDDDVTMGVEAGSAYLFKRRCNPAQADLMSVEGEIVSAYSEDFVNGWTHYCSCDGKLLLSIEKGSSGAVIRDDGINLKVENPTATFYNAGCGTDSCFINNQDGAVVFNRKWEVSPFTQPSSDLSVRFYFTAEDLNAVNSLLFSNGLEVLANASELSFYKVTNTNLGVHPNVANVTSSNVIVLTHGASPTTNRWVLANHGVSDYYAEFQVSSFSGGGGGAGSGGDALPVELLSFDADLKDKQVDLNWATASEKNNLGFTIERSANLDAWTILEFVEGQGTSTDMHQYTTQDLRPVAGNNYYRLKQEDFNGTSTYSDIVQVFLEKESKVSPFIPNPVEVGGLSELQFFVEEEAIANLDLYSNTGVLVYQKTLTLERGGTNVPISTEQLSAGVYFLSVEINDLRYQQKLVVVRD